MRAHRSSGGTRLQAPFRLLAPNNIFARDVRSLPTASNQEPARKIANQLNYNNLGYEHWYGYTGPGFVGAGHRSPAAQVSTYTITSWVVSATQPTQKVTFVNAAGEPQPAGESSNLQEPFNAVPMPTLSAIPSGELICKEGTDGWFVVWRINLDGTVEMWEMWRLAGTNGAYTFRFGGYVRDSLTWDGIFTNGWGTRATGLALVGGMISIQDLVEVLYAAKHGLTLQNHHALLLNAPVTEAAGPIAPATRHDEKSAPPELWEGKPNPAYGSVDGVAEGSWFRLPNPAVGTNPIERWIEECLYRCGWVVGDSAGQAAFDIESPLALGSPFSWANVTPYVPTSFGKGSFSYIPPSLEDETLAHLTEGLGSENTRELFEKIKWNEAELLEPRSS